MKFPVESLNSSYILLTKNSTKSILAFNSTFFIINLRYKSNAIGVYQVSIPETNYRNFMNTRAYLWLLNKGLIEFYINSEVSISLINCLTL